MNLKNLARSFGRYSDPLSFIIWIGTQQLTKAQERTALRSFDAGRRERMALRRGERRS
jgi:hypothetical protein